MGLAISIMMLQLLDMDDLDVIELLGREVVPRLGS
jgi:hypothetical protein